MANLTSNSPRNFHGDSPPGSMVNMAVDANTKLWTGAALMRSQANGCLINCTPTASGEFAGFADEPVDNSTGSPLGGTAGSTTCRVQTHGPVFLTVANGSNWARTDTEATIYASDGDTFTTSAGTNNIVIGRVLDVPEAAIGAASAVVLVYAQAGAVRSI